MKTVKRIISSFLCFALLITVVSAFSIAEEDGVEFEPLDVKRLSVSVRGADSTSVGFCWYTQESAENAFVTVASEAGDSETYDVEPSEWEGNYLYKLTVTGLKKNTRYSYTLGSTDHALSGNFKTGGGDKVSFVNIADVQASSMENFSKGAATLRAGLEKLPDADFVSNMGDFTNDSTNTEWDYYAANFDELSSKATLVPVAGNHDGLGCWHWFDNMFDLDKSGSVQNLNGVNYSFDYGNAHFAVLNTNDLASVTFSQLRWLKNDLDSTDKDWKIVFMHKSPYTLGKDGKWPDAMYLQKSLVKVLDACDVDLVMSGHDHQYLRTKPLTNNKLAPDGVTYVLSGTAGSKRYEIRSFLAGHFLNKKFIDALVVQKNGYGNYWNGTDWDSTDEDNIGGCFQTVEIEGGVLKLNAYILSDEKQTLKNIDTLTLTKQTGQNKASYNGSNTTSKAQYIAGLIPSAIGLAAYSFVVWLPKFITMLPQLIYVYITEDTF